MVVYSREISRIEKLPVLQASDKKFILINWCKFLLTWCDTCKRLLNNYSAIMLDYTVRDSLILEILGYSFTYFLTSTFLGPSPDLLHPVSCSEVLQRGTT